MEQYLVSARKYRPTKFVDVVGQQHITTTLKNAIKQNQVAQSFLFCGPRGVGKTTCARILAKVLNCQNQTEDKEPCNECDSCTAFNQNASFNIFELDAASNNGVDEIRLLIEQVRFAPQTGKYKIYIIDEVHMLSPAAFNAFLKTLEEPPSYAIFILATTEKHKLLPTIISRCQVFDFHRIGNQDIVNHLAYIAEDEKTEAEPEALHIIAQKADGGLRDALSIYDRMSSFSAGKISYQSVLENLNVLDYDYFFKITDGIQLQDRSLLMLTIDEILRNGFNGAEFISSLASHFRNLLMAKAPNTVKILEVSENWKKKYTEQASVLSTGFILSCLNIANNCSLGYRDAKNKRLQIELALLKMCYLQEAIDLSRQSITASEQNTNIPVTEKKNEISKTAPVQKAAIQTKETEINNTVTAQKNEVKPLQAEPAVPTKLEEKATPQLITKTNNNGSGGLKFGASLASISSDIKKEIAGNTKPKLNYESNEIIGLWNDFVAKHDSPRTQGVLQQHQMSLESKKLFTQTNSTFNQAELKNEIKKFIEGLKHIYESVELSYEVNYIKPENDHLPKKVYTAEDKYKVMAEKNPALATLKQNLGLEFEY